MKDWPYKLLHSPDGRFLRYTIFPGNSDSTSFKIVAQELQTGMKHTYQLSGNDTCVSWSPSSTQVSYISQHALIVENLTTGTHRVLVQEASQIYHPDNNGSEYTIFGGIDCGA